MPFDQIVEENISAIATENITIGDVVEAVTTDPGRATILRVRKASHSLDVTSGFVVGVALNNATATGDPDRSDKVSVRLLNANTLAAKVKFASAATFPAGTNLWLGHGDHGVFLTVDPFTDEMPWGYMTETVTTTAAETVICEVFICRPGMPKA